MPVKFEVLGVPVGKGRPKFSTVNGHAVAYTPAKTANYETLVRLSYQQQIGAFMFDKDKPLRAIIRAFFPIPKSASKKKREQMEAGKIRHTKKCDADNIAKACLDALNGIAFYDDSQVCELSISKFYGDTPKVEIIIDEVI
jgi:Holliday junction resolvase RusA-like endonuclease